MWCQVHGECETVITRFRPVPLTWHYCHTLEGATQLVPLLNPKGTGLSPQMLGKDIQPGKDPSDDDDSFLNRFERRRRRCCARPYTPQPWKFSSIPEYSTA